MARNPDMVVLRRMVWESCPVLWAYHDARCEEGKKHKYLADIPPCPVCGAHWADGKREDCRDITRPNHTVVGLVQAVLALQDENEALKAKLNAKQ